MRDLPLQDAVDTGASLRDRATHASHQAPAGLGHPVSIPSAGKKFSAFDDTDWHVLAQDIAAHWAHPEEVAIAYQAAAEAIKILRRELDRRDRNELRNCINWGPCSENDGPMGEPK